jgi:hypothetical protein
VILNKACFFTRIGTMVFTGNYRSLQVSRLKSWRRPRTLWRVYRVVSELAPHLHDVIAKIAWEAGPVPKVTRRERFDLNNALREDMS